MKQLRFDVVVIGSGAAGSVMAYELVRRGLSVVVLERGSRVDPSQFEHNEPAMYARLYKHGGLQTTADRNTTIVQGGAVGGSTVINNAIWLRANLDRVLADWTKAGAPVPREPLERAYEELEFALGVSPVPANMVNKGTDAFLRGCAKLGIPAELLRNNRRECIGCGWCNYGCRYNRKTSMLVTYLAWAEARGVKVLDRCDDIVINHQTGHASGVHFWRNTEEHEIKTDRVVVCAGAVGSSAVLLKSNIALDGRVGAGFHLMGGVLVNAELDEAVNGFDGIGLTSMAHASHEYVIENFFSPPLVFSLSMGGFFSTHFARMNRYPYFATAGVMVGTAPSGRIQLKQRQVQIDLTFSNSELEALRKGIRRLGEIFFAGGAKRILPATFKRIEFTRPEELDRIEQFVRQADDLLIGSAHPQGGNAISEDPGRGVVGLDFRVHGFDNVFVADASVFPTNIWVNCQATVMATSHVAAAHVARG